MPRNEGVARVPFAAVAVQPGAPKSGEVPMDHPPFPTYRWATRAPPVARRQRSPTRRLAAPGDGSGRDRERSPEPGGGSARPRPSPTAENGREENAAPPRATRRPVPVALPPHGRKGSGKERVERRKGEIADSSQSYLLSPLSPSRSFSSFPPAFATRSCVCRPFWAARSTMT